MIEMMDGIRTNKRSKRVVNKLLKEGWGNCKDSLKSARTSTKTRLQEIIDSETGQADDRSSMTAD
jgi:hypothetical protein